MELFLEILLRFAIVIGFIVLILSIIGFCIWIAFNIVIFMMSLILTLWPILLILAAIVLAISIFRGPAE